MQTPRRFAHPSKTIGWAVLACLVGVATVQGCAEGVNESNARLSPDVSAKISEPPSGNLRASGRPLAVAVAERGELEQTPGGAEASAVPSPKAATSGRKIIYEARVDLVAENLGKLEADLLRLIEKQNAYVADSDQTGSPGTTRRAVWKVRVPVDTYDGFIQGLKSLGELVSLHAQSQDVSAEYYDLDARQVAKKVEETRLLKHLSDSTGRLDEILTVERELSRVRSEIERMQGRLAVLANQTSLATVTITASEIVVPVAVAAPAPPLPPTLYQKVALTFTTSLGALQGLGETVLLILVAIAPWVPVLIPAGFLLWVWVRRANVYLATNHPEPTPRGTG